MMHRFGMREKKHYSALAAALALILLAVPSVPAMGGVAGKGSGARTEAQEIGPGAGKTAAETAAPEVQESAAAEETAAQEETAAAEETAAQEETQAAEETRTQGENGRVTLIAAGDNLIHKTIVDKAWRPEVGNYDFHFLYTETADLFRSRDLAVINQETIFISDNALISDYPAFGTPQVMGEALYDTGFDIVLSATNHTWDKGERGVMDTLNYWKTVHPDVKLLGIHESPEAFNSIDYLEKNGIRFALFNYTYGLNGYSPSRYYLVNLLSQKDKFLSDVRTAEQNADMTICFLHIGEEYMLQPTAFQKAYISELIDAGADLVICAHPHVVEPAGIVSSGSGKSALVYYSCGNFVSAQSKLDRILGGLADVTIVKDENGARIESWDFIPVVTHFSGMDVRTFLLKDYTDELAAINHASVNDGLVTTNRLWNEWRMITGRN